MQATSYPHITLDENGVPKIDGTRMKVVHIVLDQLAYHWDAEEIQRQYPSLSLAEIHSALAYYYDHQDAIDREIEDGLNRHDELYQKAQSSPIRAKLLAARRKP